MKDASSRFLVTIKIRAESWQDILDCLEEADQQLASGKRKLAFIGQDSAWSLEVEERKDDDRG